MLSFLLEAVEGLCRKIQMPAILTSDNYIAPFEGQKPKQIEVVNDKNTLKPLRRASHQTFVFTTRTGQDLAVKISRKNIENSFEICSKNTENCKISFTLVENRSRDSSLGPLEQWNILFQKLANRILIKWLNNHMYRIFHSTDVTGYSDREMIWTNC